MSSSLAEMWYETNEECLKNRPQHEGKPWFHPSIKREQAEDMLSHVRKEGAFLVRMGERILGSFAITFRAENKVRV